jgi:hypothetical protein
MRTAVLLGFAALAVAAAAWHWRVELKQRLASGATATSPPGLRKCMAGERVVYTDGACPRGMRGQAFDGALSVVPAGPAARPVEPAASTLPHARTLLAPPGGPDLKEQRIDAVIGR